MDICRFRLLALVLFTLASIGFAQGDPEADKAKQTKSIALVEEAVSDISNMKLPENRAHFYAQAGERLWPADQKRARQLFQNAAAELMAAQEYAETKLRRSNPYTELLTGGSTRQAILNTIARRDAELALELLAKTRPAIVQRAMNAELGNPGKISDIQNYSYLAQNERAIEQNFYRLAAEQNPDRAAKLLKDAISKGASTDTFNQLVSFAQKDQSTAEDLGSDMTNRLLHEKFSTGGQVNYRATQLAQTILNYALSSRGESGPKLRLDPAQIRELANNVVASYLNDKSVAGYFGSVQQIAEHFVPASAAAVKAVAATYTYGGGSDPDQAAFQKLMQSETPPEALLAAADKLPPNYRRQLYEAASQRFQARGQIEAARATIADNFSDEAREQMLSNFDMQQNYRLTNEGRFAEAEQVIERLPEPQRIGALTNLATAVFNKDKEANKNYALTILDKARGLVPLKPTNGAEMGNLMQIIAAYGTIDIDQAFGMYESLIPQINELLEAAAVFTGFQMNSNVRDGEFIMSQGDPLGVIGANGYALSQFAASDLVRTTKLIDSLSRPELRVSLRLQIATGVDGANRMTQIVNLPIGGRNFRGGFCSGICIVD